MSYKDPEKQKEYLRQWWQDKKNELGPSRKTYRDEHKERNEEYIDRNRQYLLELKKDGCTVCGYNDEVRELHFHHLDPETKSGELHRSVTDQWSIVRIDVEVEKCILVCAKCHTNIHLGKIEI